MGTVLSLVTREQLSEQRDQRLMCLHKKQREAARVEIQELHDKLFAALLAHAIHARREDEAGREPYMLGCFQDRVYDDLCKAMRDTLSQLQNTARAEFAAKFNELMESFET